MVTMKRVWGVGLLVATSAVCVHPQVPTWQEHVEILAKSLVIRVEQTWLQVPDLFDPASWVVEVDNKPGRVLAVRKLIAGRSGDESAQASGSTTSVTAWNERIGDAGDLGTTVLLLSRMCDARNLGRSVAKLLAEAEQLLAAGPVSVGVVERGTRLLCSRVKKTDEVKTCLSSLAREKTVNEILQLRKWGRDLRGSSPRVASLAGFLEERAISQAVYRDVTSALQVAGAGAGLVILIWDGADGDAWDFWREFDRERKSFTKGGKKGSTESSSGTAIDDSRKAMEWFEIKSWAEELAVDGKVAISLYPGFGSSMYPSWGAAFSGSARFQDFMDSRREWQPSEGVSEYVLSPDSYRVPRFMAEMTGGTVINPKDSLKNAFLRLQSTLAITFQVQGSIRCGNRPVKVYHRQLGPPMHPPKAVRFCSEPEPRPELLQLFDVGLRSLGEVRVQADVERFKTRDAESSEVVIHLKVDAAGMAAKIANAFEPRWRITVALLSQASGSAQKKLIASAPQMMPPNETNVRVGVSIPADAHRLLILVEELQTGAWGAAVLDLKGEGNP